MAALWPYTSMMLCVPSPITRVKSWHLTFLATTDTFISVLNRLVKHGDIFHKVCRIVFRLDVYDVTIVSGG